MSLTDGRIEPWSSPERFEELWIWTDISCEYYLDRRGKVLMCFSFEIGDAVVETIGNFLSFIDPVTNMQLPDIRESRAPYMTYSQEDFSGVKKD